jgi:hypothetical protein
MISPAPNIYPSGLRPVAATGAGVHFATSPNGERSGVRAQGRVGGIQFTRRPAGLGLSDAWAGKLPDGSFTTDAGCAGYVWGSPSGEPGSIFRRPDSWDEECRIVCRHGYSA